MFRDFVISFIRIEKGEGQGIEMSHTNYNGYDTRLFR